MIVVAEARFLSKINVSCRIFAESDMTVLVLQDKLILKFYIVTSEVIPVFCPGMHQTFIM